MAKEPAEELNQNHLSMEQIWNSDYMKQVRRDMLAGKWRPECTECQHLERNGIGSSRQKKYAQSDKGKQAQKKAQKKYDEKNLEKRREQKREYMRRKRAENPNYCKWK